MFVILINQNNYNVLVWQPWLAADIYWVQHIPWDYWVELHQKRDKIEVAFQPLLLADIMALVKVVHDEPDQVPSKEEARQEPYLTFGPHPDTQASDFDFEKSSRVFSLQAQSERHSFR